MTSLLEGARKLVSRGTDIGARIEGMDAAIVASRGRLPDELLDDSQAVLERASSRLWLSPDHTVVAIAGATGSGKSSTFNALTGLELSAVGVRRPTTSWATACVWAAEGTAHSGTGAEDLLDWLGIPARHRVVRDSMLDSRREDDAMRGVVLLDLPDHDSTEVSHHLEVDRLVQLADLMIWVLDPQKYADMAVHDRYLAPLASHRQVMVVILNHIDAVAPDRRESMLADVRRLLDQDGLRGVPVIPTSARTGEGLDRLRDEIASRVAAKKVVRMRLEADLRGAAQRMHEATGSAPTPSLSKESIATLEDALADSAGVPTVVRAVHDSTRLRANRATGWPVVAWLSRLRPDPLKRLHLDLGSAGRELTGRARTSVPQPTNVQRARVDNAVRALADDVSANLSRSWAQAVREASLSRHVDLGDRLDRALADTDLGASRIPAWAGLVRVIQWLLLLLALGGAVWLGAVFLTRYLTYEMPDTPDVAGYPLALVVLVGGVVLGILFALFCRLLVRGTARRRARTADRRLRSAISDVADDLVVTPVRDVLAAYDPPGDRPGVGVALRGFPG
jgi:GTP-binding protein EngB required for normal cell division